LIKKLGDSKNIIR
jgi:hypothetical protein